MPAWARVIPAAPLADVLIIDNDASAVGLPDYVDIYTTHTLEALGRTYAVVRTDGFGENTSTPRTCQLPAMTPCSGFTGDNFYSAVTVSGVAGTLGLTEQDWFSLLDLSEQRRQLDRHGARIWLQQSTPPPSKSSTVYLLIITGG